MKWIVTLSNGTQIDEDQTLLFDNPNKLTPWLVLQEYIETSKLSIRSIELWDRPSLPTIRLYSTGKLAGQLPDFIDFRRRFIGEGMSSGGSVVLYGIIIVKNSVSFGVWCNPETREIFTTIE
jgi:hypothetical protein